MVETAESSDEACVRQTTVEPWASVEELLLAAGGRPEQVESVVRRIGLTTTMDILAEELRLRCDPPALDEPCEIQLEVYRGGERDGRVLTVGDRGLEVRPGWSEMAVAHIRVAAADLVESLFGPADHRRPAQLETTWSAALTGPADLTGLASWQRFSQRWQQASLATHAVLAACEVRPVDLGELSTRFGSDKWAMLHWYTQHYNRHFARFRHKPVRVLEIGIGGYGFDDHSAPSLWMWQRYFARGLVYGLDIFPKPGVRGPRVRTVQGDQNDPEFLDALGSELGPFDIVIDDGSHVNEHVRTSFHSLFRHLRPGGLYVIEDTQTAYWPGYGGASRHTGGSATSMAMLKELVDGLNHQDDPGGNGNPPSYTDRHVAGLHFYHGLVIVDKGLNADEAVPDFVPRQPYAPEAMPAE